MIEVELSIRFIGEQDILEDFKSLGFLPCYCNAAKIPLLDLAAIPTVGDSRILSWRQEDASSTHTGTANHFHLNK